MLAPFIGMPFANIINYYPPIELSKLYWGEVYHGGDLGQASNA